MKNELNVISTENNELFYCGKVDKNGKKINILSNIPCGIKKANINKTKLAMETLKREGFAVCTHPKKMYTDEEIMKFLKTLKIKSWIDFAYEFQGVTVMP